jgi:hypothetical protein
MQTGLRWHLKWARTLVEWQEGCEWCFGLIWKDVIVDIKAPSRTEENHEEASVSVTEPQTEICICYNEYKSEFT